MAIPKIRDLKGREVRVQRSADNKLIDLYLGPEKTRHRSPLIRWWTSHRRLSAIEARKLLRRLNQVVGKLK